MIWWQGLDPSTRTVKKVYGAETMVLQAFWCHMCEERVLCVRERECLAILMESGAVHYVPFTFLVSGRLAWPCTTHVSCDLSRDLR